MQNGNLQGIYEAWQIKESPKTFCWELEGTNFADRHFVRFVRNSLSRRPELQRERCLPAVMPPLGQPEFTIAVETMRGHVVWNPPRDLEQTPVLSAFCL